MPLSAFSRGAVVRGDPEVVLDRQFGQQTPAFGHHRDAGAADALGRRLVRSWSPSRTCPDVGRSAPADREHQRRLAGAVRPEQRGDLAGRDSIETSRSTGRPARGTESFSIRSMAPSPFGPITLAMLGAEVGPDHLLVPEHLGGRAGSDQPAEVEHRDHLATGRDQAHVVVDEHHERSGLDRGSAG